MASEGSDIIVIGGGMAGISTAAQLAATLRVIVLEREPQPGYHATGRSAAIFSETYGNAAIRALSRCSGRFFFEPPAGFSEAPIATRCGWLYVARADQRGRLDAFAQDPTVAGATRRISARQARELSPLLRPGYCSEALLEPDAAELDVHALLGGYLRRLRQQGGKLVTNAEVRNIDAAVSGWRVDTTAGLFQAPILVNAAGAWVDEIAKMAGAVSIGIRPLRRTAVLLDAPAGVAIGNWPVTIDVDEQFYFKPDAGRILVSPADETPSPPCDAMPEEWDIAVAVDRMESATLLQVTTVGHKWAGLRSFVRDRSPVVGYESSLPGFFWVAALGGYGIQTAPAVGRLASALIRECQIPEDLLAEGIMSNSFIAARLTDAPEGCG